MHVLYERIFALGRNPLGRIACGALIGGLLGFVAIAGEPSLRTSVSITAAVVGTAAVGVLSVFLLEWVDLGRRRRDRAGDARPMFRERAMGCALVFGLVLGCLSALCGVAMGVVHVVNALRGR